MRPDLRPRRPAAPDDGSTMVVVLLVGLVVVLLAATMTLRSARLMNRTLDDRQWTQALDVAEAGLDVAMYFLDRDGSWTTGETLPAGASSWTRAQERAWVLSTLSSAPAERFQRLPEGEWAVVKPSGETVVFAAGYVPSRAAARRPRVIRAEYVPGLSGTALGYALLVGGYPDGDLELGGKKIDGPVHANGDVAVAPKPSLSGPVTATGTCQWKEKKNPCGANAQVPVPEVRARTYYSQSRYDLCPDGTVRAGPVAPFPGAPRNSTDVPCGGPSLAGSLGTRFPWSFSAATRSAPPKWSCCSGEPIDSVYYLLRTSVVLGSNAGVYDCRSAPDGTPYKCKNGWLATLLGEAAPTAAEPHCPHGPGDIAIEGTVVVSPNPALPGLTLVSGRDFVNAGTATTRLSGVVYAHEQVKLEGTPRIFGSVIAENVCDTADSAVTSTPRKTTLGGEAEIVYDPDLKLPIVGGFVRSKWREL